MRYRKETVVSENEPIVCGCVSGECRRNRLKTNVRF